MNDACTLLLDGVSGSLLGSLYFGGLWWTVRKLALSNRGGVWLLASLVIRSTVTVTGFLLVSHQQWQALLACLVGFLMARVVSIRLARTFGKTGYAPQPR